MKRQQGCLQCCRASCRLGVECTSDVVHKSGVATRCASKQKENMERCRLLLTDSQSQVCLGDEKERAVVGAELIPVSTTILPEINLVEISREQAVFSRFLEAHLCIYNSSSRKKSCRDFKEASSLLEDSRSFQKRCFRIPKGSLAKRLSRYPVTA